MLYQKCCIENAVRLVYSMCCKILEEIFNAHVNFNENSSQSLHWKTTRNSTKMMPKRRPGDPFGDLFQRYPLKHSGSPTKIENSENQRCSFSPVQLFLARFQILGGPILALVGRQWRQGSIFGAPRASKNRSKINKNEGHGKP